MPKRRVDLEMDPRADQEVQPADPEAADKELAALPTGQPAVTLDRMEPAAACAEAMAICRNCWSARPKSPSAN
jgi:hypothetical protein